MAPRIYSASSILPNMLPADSLIIGVKTVGIYRQRDGAVTHHFLHMHVERVPGVPSLAATG